MENNTYLYGASGHCKVILDILEQNNIAISCILDDNVMLKSILDKTVQNTSDFQIKSNENLLISIGNNKIRKEISNRIKANYITAIHPKAIISSHSVIGEGSAVMAGAIINSDVAVGKHCIINSGAVVEHDCKIHNFAHISPNASLAGGVEVGEGSQVGIGAVVIQGKKIGKWAIIGAGAVILKDVPDYAVVVGNPGKIIKYTNSI